MCGEGGLQTSHELGQRPGSSRAQGRPHQVLDRTSNTLAFGRRPGFSAREDKLRL